MYSFLIGNWRELMIKELTISQKDLDFIQIQLEINKPYEACGVIIGTTSDTMVDVKRVIPVTNVRRTEASFELDPREFYNAWSDAEKDGNEIVGVYHTHPFYAARPSSWDINTMKNVPSVWLIAGVGGIYGYIYDDGIENVKIWIK
jgi:[CysO sulfur-carrier protein]-S-L-cysteine hydrolase